jgi:ABC-2 type transport system ATP-binding protein
MGENGAGKSTLLKICAGVLPFDNGEVTIDGFSILKNSIKARKQIGYLPEMPEMYDRLTGREFLFYIASLRKLNDSEKIISDFSKMIGIDEFLDYELGGYSKGMKQKISVISAMMHSPNNLLLDEPVYGLDPLTSRTIQDFIKKRQGTTIIATHSTQLVEQVADSVYLLMRGRVISFDKVATLLDKYGTMEKAYFHYKDEVNV